MITADHDQPGEDLLERGGRLGALRGRPGNHATQEPARAVHAHEPDRLEPALRRIARHPDVQFRAERAVRLLGAATRLGHRGDDLLPHVLPEPVALGRRKGLDLQRAVLPYHRDQRSLVVGDVELDLEPVHHRDLEAAEVDPVQRRDVVRRVPRPPRWLPGVPWRGRGRLDPGAVPGLIVPGLVPGLLVVRLEVLADLVLADLRLGHFLAATPTEHCASPCLDLGAFWTLLSGPWSTGRR